MEPVFTTIREGIIGINTTIATPYHAQIPMIYADWTASGRMYRPIEERLLQEVYPLVANTHTETNTSGRAMTQAYHAALTKIKQHVNAGENDVIICEGSGMTGVVNKFQRIIGLKVHESFRRKVTLSESNKPVVFVTHMEHHSNHISWSETLADVEIIPAGTDGLPDLNALETLLLRYGNRRFKYAAITAASNVTGIPTPYCAIARLLHRHGGYCFVDFACAAPYVPIDMHPSSDPEAALDAIFFSPHKFLGGPGSSGVVIFNRRFYHNHVPDNPGGGTVTWTSPFAKPVYIDSIEAREDGGTPGFLQVIRTALAIELKEEMGIERILAREKQQVKLVMDRLEGIPGLRLLEARHRERLGVFSIYIDGLYIQLGVRILNDRFGIQVRGGCSCAGTYGHYLFGMTEEQSCAMLKRVEAGDYMAKPGWIRMSVHPTMTDDELVFICNAIRELAANHTEWAKAYHIDAQTGAIRFLKGEDTPLLKQLFRPLVQETASASSVSQNAG